MSQRNAFLPPQDFFQRHVTAHMEIVHEMRLTLAEPFACLAETCWAAIQAGKKLLFLGNGGSAADAQHLAAEFVVRFEKERRGLPALALTTDTSVLTAGGNDYGFEKVFARQIDALGQKGDVLLAFTTSGKSPNVLAALEMAEKKGLVRVVFTGAEGALRLASGADLVLAVPSSETARIQEMHILLGHMLCAVIDSRCAVEGSPQLPPSHF